jgi:aspartate/methionine/tyrosine aminotransferase
MSVQIDRLHLRGGAGPGLASVVAAERALEARSTELARPLLNLTYADTHRFPPPPWALEAFTRAAGGAGMTYTPYRGDAEVRRHVARSLSDLLGRPVDPERELILTPGSQAALFTVLGALLEDGDHVVLPDPDYLAYERLITYVGGAVDRVDLHRDNGAGRLDPDQLRAAIRPETRCMVLSNPNNPTGAVLTAETVELVADIAREHDLTVVVDELYARLVYDERPYIHLGTLDGMAERSVTVLGPSKTESLSGYRLGVAVAAPEMIDAMEDVLSVAALRAPAYAQWALVHWIAEDGPFIAERVRDYQRLRDMTVERLSSSPAIDVVTPGGTAYAFPSLVGVSASDQEVALALMEQAEVIINPGYQFGANGHGSFRICFAQEESVWERALDRIAATLEGLAAR